MLSRSKALKYARCPGPHLDLAVAGGPGCQLWQMAVPLLMQWHVCDSPLGAFQGPKAAAAGSSLSEELHDWGQHTCRNTKQPKSAQH